jgi:hypothetical protein
MQSTCQGDFLARLHLTKPFFFRLCFWQLSHFWHQAKSSPEKYLCKVTDQLLSLNLTAWIRLGLVKLVKLG